MALSCRISLEKELAKNPEITQDMLENVKRWLKTQPHLPQNIPEILLVFFLHSCFFEIEETKRTIDHYYTIRTRSKEIFHDRDPRQESLIESTNVVSHVYLPERTPKGERVIFSKFLNLDPSKYFLYNVTKMYFNLMDLELHQNGTSNGDIIVFDMKGMTLAHYFKWSLSAMRVIAGYLQDGIPMRLVSLHIINATPLMDKIYAFTRPLVSAEMVKKLHIHPENSMENFYKFVPKKILPNEYGGSSPSWEELRKKSIDNIFKNYQFIIDQEKIQVNESLRPEKPRLWKFWK